VRNSANSGPGELIAMPGGTRREMMGVVAMSRDTDAGMADSWVVGVDR
jgi:hypothetical protein